MAADGHCRSHLDHESRLGIYDSIVDDCIAKIGKTLIHLLWHHGFLLFCGYRRAAHCSFQANAFQYGTKKFLHPLSQGVRFHQSEAANLSIFLPTDKGQLVPCAYIRLLAQILWQNHLATLIDSNERFDCAAGFFSV
jgi:hypothetical protein